MVKEEKNIIKYLEYEGKISLHIKKLQAISFVFFIVKYLFITCPTGNLVASSAIRSLKRLNIFARTS